MRRYAAYSLKALAALVLLAFAGRAATGCSDIAGEDPWEGRLNSLAVSVEFPQEYVSFLKEGIPVSVENIYSSDTYVLSTDASGKASAELPRGLYRVTVSYRSESDIFNGSSDKVKVSGEDVLLNLKLSHSKAGSLVFKEIYTGGCNKYPEEGNYQSDQYLIVHNNDDITGYLDSLCIGTLSPYNSTAANPWISRDPVSQETIFADFLPIIQAVWMIPGDGRTFPIEPGEDAVICLRGAIDHKAQYYNSVNLNNEKYFVCYNPTYFPNPVYHPAPGNLIRQDHYLEVVIKTGQANAYTMSISSPTVVMFKARGQSIYDFVAAPGNLVQVPGSTIDRVVKVPPEWVLDAVEVFDGRSGANAKRLMPALDAGAVFQSDIYQSHSLFRRVDEEKSAEAGFEILMDTNNSTNDMYERQRQSLND